MLYLWLIVPYLGIGYGVIATLVRWALDNGEGERAEVDLRTSDWLVLAGLVIIWPIVVTILAIMSLASGIIRLVCRN